MSWSQNVQNEGQSRSDSSSNDSSSVGPNSSFQSLCYLLLNNGNLQDLVKQQHLLQSNGISSLEQLQQQLQEGQSHNLPDQQHQVQHSLQERDDEQQMQQQDAFDENAEIEAGEGGQELRYRKTMNALEKAGLLDLTLKISELIKQNEALQKDIDTLEHIVETTYMVVMGNQP